MIGVGVGLRFMSPSASSSAPPIAPPKVNLYEKALVAVSTSRKLTPSASKCMRIRRKSDNAEIDIAFVGGNIDEQAISEFGGYNLLGHTENFNASNWAHRRITVESSQIANPFNGDVNVQKIIESNLTGAHQVSKIAEVASGENYTLSVYLKKAELDSFTLLVPPTRFSANSSAVFNLTKGTSTGNSFIESLGDGWYRCSLITVTANSNGAQAFYLRTGVGLGDGSSGLYLWGAQLTKGSDVKPYQPRLAGGASDCFIATLYDQSGNNNHATQTVAARQPKIYDVASGKVSKENGKSAIVFDGVNDNIEIPNVAGRLNIDAYFVNRYDGSSLTSANATRYLYFSAANLQYGFVGQSSGGGGLYRNYGTPNLYRNNSLLSPSNRKDVFDLLGQTQNIVNHQGARVSNWDICNFGFYPAARRAWSFEGTLQEIIVFVDNLTAEERQDLHNDINTHYKIY